MNRPIATGSLYGVNYELHPHGITCYATGGVTFSRFYVGYSRRAAVLAFRRDVLGLLPRKRRVAR